MAFSALPTVLDTHERLKAKELTCSELVEDSLGKLEAQDSKLKAYLCVRRDKALKRANELDDEIKGGKLRGPLHGIPVAIKDNIVVKDSPTTCGSNILKSFHSPYDATVVQKLEAAGAVIVGKTNLDEFAMGSSTEHSAFGPSRNPWNPEYAPGGSSGGSAVTVAAGAVPLALGSDTGGSIRQPASYCGVVGMKPTYGRVSRYGLVAFASSLDQIGPFARNVTDAALLFEALCGHDENDSTSIDENVASAFKFKDIEARKKNTPRKVGIIRQSLGEGTDPEVKDAFEQSVKHCRDAGYDVSEMDMPSFDYAIAAYYVLATSEASANLARYDGVRYGHRSPDASNLTDLYLNSRSEGFGKEVKRRIMLGTYALSAGYYDAYYKRAQKVRRLIRDDFTKAFESFDLLLLPTAPGPAFRLGEKTEDPLAMYLTDIDTVAVNLAGLPALSMPCGKTRSGLPIGFQLIARPFGEATLFDTALTLEPLFAFDYKDMAI